MTYSILLNYADDSTLSIIASTIEVVLATLKQDTENTIKWFKINFMQGNPSKFQCMFLKPLTNKEEMPKFIKVNGTNIPCEKEVKLLSITMDEKLKFDKDVNILCKKADRQINVMYSFKGVFDLKERQIIYNTCILSNFNYCPIIWHFCGTTCTKKIEATQERALLFIFNDKTSTYSSLLEKCNYTTLHIRRINAIASEVFKSLNNLNPNFINKMFQMKDITNDLRDSNIYVNKITYGKKTLSYYVTHIWNSLPNNIKESTSLDNFKTMLKEWEGPKCQCNMCNNLN